MGRLHPCKPHCSQIVTSTNHRRNRDAITPVISGRLFKVLKIRSKVTVQDYNIANAINEKYYLRLIFTCD